MEPTRKGSTIADETSALQGRATGTEGERHEERIRFSGIVALGLVVFAAASVSATEGVSPGAADRFAVVEGVARPSAGARRTARPRTRSSPTSSLRTPCKRRSWQPTTEVLFTRVAGSATSWTPSADRCFAPGGRYVWFVRAVSESPATRSSPRASGLPVATSRFRRSPRSTRSAAHSRCCSATTPKGGGRAGGRFGFCAFIRRTGAPRR